MNKTLQEQYNLIKEGKGNKQQFFKSARHIFPDLITPVNTFEDTVTILKNRGVIAESIGGLVTKGKTPDWHSIFKEKVAEAKEAKAEEKEPTKEVTDMETKGYDYKDKKNYDNVFGQEFLKGFYTEMGDSKNEGKTVEELRAIVAKNLAKDINYYVKDGQFGVKGVGYTTEAPGLGTPKEAKGKHKSSGYGDLKESLLRSQIQLLIKEVLAENSEFKKNDKVEFNNDVWTVIGTSVDSDGDKFVDIKLGDKTHMNTPVSAIKKIDQSLLDLDKEFKGKHKSSGYGDLKESLLRTLISEMIKEVLAEGIHDKDILSNPQTNIKTPPKGVGDYNPKQAAARLKRLANMGPKPKNTDEALTPADEMAFSKAATFAEKLYDKVGNVEDVLANLPKQFIRFKDELEQHLTQKFEG